MLMETVKKKLIIKRFAVQKKFIIKPQKTSFAGVNQKFIDHLHVSAASRIRMVTEITRHVLLVLLYCIWRCTSKGYNIIRRSIW